MEWKLLFCDEELQTYKQLHNLSYLKSKYVVKVKYSRPEKLMYATDGSLHPSSPKSIAEKSVLVVKYSRKCSSSYSVCLLENAAVVTVTGISRRHLLLVGFEFLR